MKGELIMLRKFFNNTKKPEGFGGRLMIKMMNSGHARMAKWGLNHISPKPDSRIIDLGCGGGANIKELLKICVNGRVDGADYSQLSVSTAQQLNQEAVDSGRTSIIKANILKLPCGNESYDIATAFETVYFWPDIVKAFSEVKRILKPGGMFLITNETAHPEGYERWTGIIEGLKVYRAEELRNLLLKAGFSSVEVFKHKKRDWIAVLAKKDEKEI